MRLIGSGAIRPMIFDKMYDGLESLAEAMEDLAAGLVSGKAIIHIRKANMAPKL